MQIVFYFIMQAYTSVTTTTTTTTVLRPFVQDYLGEPVPGETFTHAPILIIIQPLSASSIYYDPQHHPCSIYVLDNLFCTTSLQVLFGLPLGLEPSTSYFIHYFNQSVSSFRNTCPYYHSLFCCSTKMISSIPSLSHSQLFTWDFIFYLNITIPSDHSYLCSSINYVKFTIHHSQHNFCSYTLTVE